MIGGKPANCSAIDQVQSQFKLSLLPGFRGLMSNHCHQVQKGERSWLAVLMNLGWCCQWPMRQVTLEIFINQIFLLMADKKVSFCVYVKTTLPPETSKPFCQRTHPPFCSFSCFACPSVASCERAALIKASYDYLMEALSDILGRNRERRWITTWH